MKERTKMDRTLEKKYLIYNEIANCKSDLKINVFNKYFSNLDNVTVIYTKDNYRNFATKMFNNTYDVKYGFLGTQFHNDNIFVLNQKNCIELSMGFHNKVLYSFDINLDTNVVSYIDRLVENKLEDDIQREVAKLFIGKRDFHSAVSIQPYILENTLFKNEIDDHVIRTIKNFFSVVFKSHYRSKTITSYKTKNRIKRIKRDFFDKKNNYFFEIFKNMYKITYVVFLKMYLLQISEESFDKKAKKLINFMALELKKISILEIILALEFFRKGTKIKFFGKFQNRNKNIIKDIQNVTWDIYHLRSLDFLYIFNQHPKADITLSYLYSLDKKFNEVRSIVKLHTLVVDKDLGWSFPFYQNDIVQKTVDRLKLDNLFKIGDFSKRYNIYNSNNVKQIIDKLEKEISVLFD
jgi:hypothetical protein